MPETNGEPNEALVVVFASEQESEVMVVRGLLESAGIEVLSTNFDAPQDVLPGVGGVALHVRASQAEQAKELLAESRTNSLEEGEETGEELPGYPV